MRIISLSMRTFILYLFILISLSACAQRTETVFLNKPDTLQNYYKVLLPEDASKGLLVILGGFCTNPGGSPAEHPKKYEEASSYYADAKDGGNAKYLKNVPVRLYCDPDINWVIENRRGNFATMNATDLSGCISQLKLLWNQRAEFVNCLGKGFKPDGTRHPHYFSMLDPDEFVQWANRILGNE